MGSDSPGEAVGCRWDSSIRHDVARLDPDEASANSCMIADGWLVGVSRSFGLEEEPRRGVVEVPLARCIRPYRHILTLNMEVDRLVEPRQNNSSTLMSTLISVGSLPPGQESTSDWSAPAGSLLEISLSTYLDGVESRHRIHRHIGPMMPSYRWTSVAWQPWLQFVLGMEHRIEYSMTFCSWERMIIMLVIGASVENILTQGLATMRIKVFKNWRQAENHELSQSRPLIKLCYLFIQCRMSDARVLATLHISSPKR
jgi:hypothetical protein